MCEMCEGATLEELLARDAANIAAYGYTLQAVGGSHDDPDSWVYTVGLLDAVNHPEMIVAGAPVASSGKVLASLADDALNGDVFGVGETIDLGVGIARVGPVHRKHYRNDTFNTWHNLKDLGVLCTPRLKAVQIILPSKLSHFRQRSWQPLLSRPHSRVGPA